MPAAQLATHVHRAGPDVVAVSSSLASRLPAARRMVEACRATGTPVLAGGPAFGEDGRWARAVGADGWAPDARAAAAMLDADPDGPWFTDVGPPPARPETATPARSRPCCTPGVPSWSGSPRPPCVRKLDDVPVELADDLGHLVDFLAAAVFVDDPSLFDEFVRWVGSVAIPAGLRLEEVGPVLDALAAATADSPRTAALLRRARGGLPAPVAR